MRISVALCTYNGGRYLREQLESIAKQSRRPDELVISDDASTDETATIASDFAETAPFGVRVIRNSTNLGSTANFERAIGTCAGDIIALSDQDDYWMGDKLERIEREFAANPKLGLVFSDAELVDERLRPLGINLWRETFRAHDQKRFRDGRAVEVLLQYNVVTGATLAFRSSLKPAVIPFPRLTGFIHDGWISLVASMCSDVEPIARKLIKYRQHPGQQLGAGLWRWNVPRVERYRTAVEGHAPDLVRLDELLSVFSDERLAALLSVALDPAGVPNREQAQRLIRDARLRVLANIEHLQMRTVLPRSRLRRVSKVFSALWTGQYELYSRGWQSALLDLVRK